MQGLLQRIETTTDVIKKKDSFGTTFFKKIKIKKGKNLVGGVFLQGRNFSKQGGDEQIFGR